MFDRQVEFVGCGQQKYGAINRGCGGIYASRCITLYYFVHLLAVSIVMLVER